MAKKKNNLGMSAKNWKSFLIHSAITMGTAAIVSLGAILTSPAFTEMLVGQFGAEMGRLIATVIGLIVAATFAKKYTDEK